MGKPFATSDQANQVSYHSVSEEFFHLDIGEGKVPVMILQFLINLSEKYVAAELVDYL